MKPGRKVQWSRCRAFVVAGSYLVLAGYLILSAWIDPGTYSLNFLLPTLVTAPSSLVVDWLVQVLGIPGSTGVAAGVLLASAVLQAGLLYLFCYLSAE